MIYYFFAKDSFLNYSRGDLITNSDEIRNILSADYKRFVTKVILPQPSEG